RHHLRQGRSDSPVYTNLQELKISHSSLPPVPSGSPLHILGDWETHKDLSGRHFYYNRPPGRTWKPPRTRDTSGSTSSFRGDSQGRWRTSFCRQRRTTTALTPVIGQSVRVAPRGWSEELDEHGHTLYVSEYTQEKWIKHVDEQGRPYYYSADGSRSSGSCPRQCEVVVDAPLSNGAVETKRRVQRLPSVREVPKSRSLERKQQDPSSSPSGDTAPTCWTSTTVCSGAQSSPDSDSCPSSPKHPSTPSEKCGVLNVTKITENGKKVRKTGPRRDGAAGFLSALRQGLRAAAPAGETTGRKRKMVEDIQTEDGLKFGSNQSKPEFTVDLRGGSVDWASKDKSSKKHVIELKTRQGTELLIQSEIDSVINDWFRALTETINTHAWESDEAIEEDMPESPGAEKQDKEKDHRDSKKSRVMKTSVSMDSSDQKKTRMKLKKFLTRRPTYQAVRDKGYIKDQVFGCSLTSLCQRENTTVPNFVKMCIDHVENTGLNIDGLYRVSGNLAVIQKLRFAVNHDEKVELNDSKWEDIHVTTGALKMFFRELPEPLFTYGSFTTSIVRLQTESEFNQRPDQEVAKTEHDTMQNLFKHLRRVIDHGEANRMTTQSVAIVFGPTLLRPETETGNIAVHMVYQNQIVELILLEYESIFGR
ncbi:hypothetical protein INR49_020983, partial [Caranx melampygus]